MDSLTRFVIDHARFSALLIVSVLVGAELDTFFAVVATNADVARQLANHIDDLPIRCSTSLRPGLKNAALEEWLTEFASITARSAEHIDWRAIQVRDIT